MNLQYHSVKFFNYIFDKGDYPSQWAEGIINALHKKGEHSNPDNYRKITITVDMAKIFDSILNARLYFKNDAKDNDTFRPILKISMLKLKYRNIHQ